MDPRIKDQQWLDSIFPPSRADAFFDALFGGAEEGAYDIRLTYLSSAADQLTMAFELHQRPGKCLRCNLTYGLPQVFARHPVLNVAQVARDLADACGWKDMHFTLGATEEQSDALHTIPFLIIKDA